MTRLSTLARLMTANWRRTTVRRLVTGDWRLATVTRLLIGDLRLTTDALLAVVLSPACASCGNLLAHPTRGPVCERCWHAILPLTPPLCDTCGDPLSTWRATGRLQPPAHPEHLVHLEHPAHREPPAHPERLACAEPSAHVDEHVRCPRCRRGRPSLDRARAIGAYDGVLRAIVHALKYEGRRSLARPLAMMMRDRGAEILAGAACVVPVPLHPSRRRARGFNQSVDLARRLGLPVRHALRRVRATAVQTTLPAAQRHRNVRGAFAATRVARTLRGATVVLVDDVCTTGATLDACARTLKEAGVVEVRALTAARVVSRR